MPLRVPFGRDIPELWQIALAGRCVGTRASPGRGWPHCSQVAGTQRPAGRLALIPPLELSEVRPRPRGRPADLSPPLRLSLAFPFENKHC